MRVICLPIFLIFIFGFSRADEINELIKNGKYDQAFYRIKQIYNDASQPEYLFVSGMSELSGENSASYLKDYINKSSSDSYMNDWAKLILGKYYLAQRLYVTAGKQLESIPDNSPMAAEADYLMGRCYLLSGEYKQADKMFKWTADRYNIDSNPMTGNGQNYAYWARLGLADSYLAQAEYDKARKQYQELLRPELEDDIYALALLGLAETAAAGGNRNDAGRYAGLYNDRYQGAVATVPDRQPTRPDVSDDQSAKPSRPAEYRYYIQVGAFSKKDNAIQTASIYKKSGYNVYMENFVDNGKEFYRILIGGYNSKQQAEFIKNRLEKAAGKKYILIER
jgi:tetratricopeptide (TPR) repeat protein